MWRFGASLSGLPVLAAVGVYACHHTGEDYYGGTVKQQRPANSYRRCALS